MKPALTLLLVLLAAALALPASPSHAQVKLTKVNPPDGALLEAPPEVVHLCFSPPVIPYDNTTFRFTYRMPDGRALGSRIEFQPDGKCVKMYPGLPDERPAGEYTLEWWVTAAEGDEEGSGTLRFQVSANGSPVPALSPTPAETPLAATPSPAGDTGNDGGPDILLLALITIASVGGAAVFFTLGYLVRRRIGYEPHRPPKDDEGGGGH